MQPRLLLALNNTFVKTSSGLSTHSNSKYVNQAKSGAENFKKDFENSHVKTTLFQKLLLGVGSGVISITSPSRGDMVAVMGEITGPQALEYMRGKMLESEEGRKILSEKPRISSGSVDLEKLKHYPDETLGKAYSNFLERYNYSPDARNAVKFVDDVELAYVAQRYREVHDLLHTLLNMPTNMLGEVTVKWVEALQNKLPMCAAGALFGSVRLAPKLFSRAYSTKATVKVDPNFFKETENVERTNPKEHPGVMNLKCVRLPEAILRATNMVLEGQNLKFLIENGKALESHLLFRQLPVEQTFLREKRKQILDEIRRGFPAANHEHGDPKLEKKLSDIAGKKMKFFNYNWKRINYDKSTSLQYLIFRAPAEFAVLRRVFNEIVLRDKDFSPGTLMDFGSGVGTSVWAANEVWGANIKEYFCVDASRHMNELGSQILGNDPDCNAPVVDNVHRRQFLPHSIRLYDLVVSSFSFFELENSTERLRILTNLWNNTNKYLVLVENGSNAGHDLIMEARSYLLERSESEDVKCHVFAPCPHDLFCPRLTAEGKRTPCNFKVHYHHLPISNLRCSTGIQKFSFLILKKGETPPEESRQSRIVREVLKRHKHVVCHVCTNKGNLNTFLMTASKHGKHPYRCVRHSSWGDLIPPGLTLEEKVDSKVDLEELISDEDSDDSSGEDDWVDKNAENEEDERKR